MILLYILVENQTCIRDDLERKHHRALVHAQGPRMHPVPFTVLSPFRLDNDSSTQ
jgi:hypothetical protein